LPIAAPDTVLIVDDSKAVRSLLTACLLDLGGFRVVAAASLAEARHCLSRLREQCCCAVVDLDLPDAPDGEVVDLVRRRGIPVVVLTGSLDRNLRARMLEKQVVDYVIKRNPTEIEHVAQVVAHIRDNLAIKVLVVDDSPSYRAYLQTLLCNFRYQTLTAANGVEALEVLAGHGDVSLIITDVNMPVMGGLELIEQIRQNHRRTDLAIIGLSDASKPGLSALLLKSGANDFLAKPFEVEEFYCRVTQNTNLIGYIRQVREAATRDFLTGLHNRRRLFELGAVLHADAQRGNIRLAAALVDADHFKQINDRFGHQVDRKSVV
jgi:PleD family two-component response regulator